MSEIKCPHCNTVFSIDESDYLKLVNQVRDAEFNKEIDEKMKAKLDIQKASFDMEIQKLTAKLEKAEDEKTIAVNKAVEKKDNEISKKKQEIAELKSELKNGKELAKSEKENAVNSAVKIKEDELKKKEQEINELKSSIIKGEADNKVAISKLEQDKSAEIQKLRSEIERQKNERELSEQTLENNYKELLKIKDEQIEKYKDFKQRLSTKMIGETLEQHCSNLFNQYRTSLFPNAKFDKDNDASSGSKGDFIYRDYEDGNEYISIMFEMKNEADTTATKHKKEDFFKELDKDRNEKKCEYAVLVSMLEADSELYNNGIVDVSYKYKKMYVIRPQFFIPLITLLRNAARNSLEYKKELLVVRDRQADLTMFESNIATFKSGFLDTYNKAVKRHNDAIEGIDKAIAQLTKIREALTLSNKHLNSANNKLDDLTIKRLTKGADSVYEQLMEIRKNEES